MKCFSLGQTRLFLCDLDSCLNPELLSQEFESRNASVSRPGTTLVLKADVSQDFINKNYLIYYFWFIWILRIALIVNMFDVSLTAMKILIIYFFSAADLLSPSIWPRVLIARTGSELLLPLCDSRVHLFGGPVASDFSACDLFEGRGIVRLSTNVDDVSRDPSLCRSSWQFFSCTSLLPTL